MFSSERLSKLFRGGAEAASNSHRSSDNSRGQYKIRKMVVIGFASSHNISPCHQCQLRDESPVHPIPHFPVSSTCRDAADKRASQDTGSVMISSCIQHLHVSRHRDRAYLALCSLSVMPCGQRHTKTRPPGPNQMKCAFRVFLSCFLVAELTGINLRPQFSSCFPLL